MALEGVSADPLQVGGVSLPDREGDDFRGFVRMMATDVAAQALKPARGRFNEQQRFPAAVELALPPEERFESRDDIDTGRQAAGHEMPCEPPRDGRRRTCNKHNDYS